MLLNKETKPDLDLLARIRPSDWFIRKKKNIDLNENKSDLTTGFHLIMKNSRANTIFSNLR